MRLYRMIVYNEYSTLVVGDGVTVAGAAALDCAPLLLAEPQTAGAHHD